MRRKLYGLLVLIWRSHSWRFIATWLGNDQGLILCAYCEEELVQPPHECFYETVLLDCHEEYAVRMLVGSAAHQLKECSCFVQDGARHDPPGVSPREAAKLAFDVFKFSQRRVPHDGHGKQGPALSGFGEKTRSFRAGMNRVFGFRFTA
jgi:hypothetical protein